MSDARTLDVYNSQAQEYAELTHSAKPDRRLVDFIARLPSNARVLDLGCGPGQASQILAQAGCDTRAWDASIEMVRLAAKAPGVTAECKTFEALGDLNSDSFDGVWANFSLLHAPRSALPEYLRHIARVLMSGGIFVIAVKTGTGEKRDRLGRFYTYFSQNELQTLLEQAGFWVCRTDQGCDRGLEGTRSDWVSFTVERR